MSLADLGEQRLLTLVSIFFLPLTFVTSVFGMTNMPPKDSFKPFGIVTATICVPTYFFLVSVNSPETAASVLKRIGWIMSLVASGFRRHSDRMKQFEQKYKMGEYKSSLGNAEPKRFASRTLSSYEELAPKVINPRRISRANVLHDNLPDRPPLAQPRTSEMVKFDLPEYDVQERNIGSRTPEKTLSESRHDTSKKHNIGKGFLRSFSDRIIGGPSPRSSGMLV